MSAPGADRVPPVVSAPMPWSLPGADPLADVMAHKRRAEDAYVEALEAPSKARANVARAYLGLVTSPLTATEHLAAAAGLLHDAGAELVLATRAGARQARNRLRRFLDDLPVGL